MKDEILYVNAPYIKRLYFDKKNMCVGTSKLLFYVPTMSVCNELGNAKAKHKFREKMIKKNVMHCDNNYNNITLLLH